MGAVQLSDEVERLIAGQVATGRAASLTAFLEEAVMRLVEDAQAEEEAILKASEAGLADMEAGRFITIATAEDRKHLQASLMADVRAGLAARG
jgi:predicted transcriptional regulator